MIETPVFIKKPLANPIGPIGLDHKGIGLSFKYPFVAKFIKLSLESGPAYFQTLWSLIKNIVGMAEMSKRALIAAFSDVSTLPTEILCS